MPRGKPPKGSPSVASEGDLEGYEAELEKLQRTYRIMEGDRQAYALESQEIMRKHQVEIESLKHERDELLKNLSVAESTRNQKIDQLHVNKIRALLEENDACFNEIQEEKLIHLELHKQIEEWEVKVHEHRKSHSCREDINRMPQLTAKRIRILENRLHNAMSKFNTVLTKNAALREEIETLRIEKGKFQQIYKKSEKELAAIKKDISQIIEASTLAYDQRDEAHSKIVLLKEKAEKDLQLFNAEMKELQRIINHEKRLRDFMMAKGFSRVGKTTVNRKDSDKKKGEGGAAIENYETAFREIREITGTSDIDTIVENFIKVEDTNFALFNFVNEQNNEIERLRDKIQECLEAIDTIEGCQTEVEIQNKIDEFRNEGVKLDSQRKEIMNELEKATTDASRKCAENETLLDTTNKILDQLRRGIGSLFDKIGCDRAILNDLLGSSEDVKDDNMMQYLGLIEQRANELLAAQSFLDSEKRDKPFDPQEAARVILGQVPVTPTQQLLIAPPSTGDLRLRAQSNKLLASVLQMKEEFDSDTEWKAEEEESRPLTQKELKDRIMKVVLKKEDAASKRDFRYDLSVCKKPK